MKAIKKEQIVFVGVVLFSVIGLSLLAYSIYGKPSSGVEPKASEANKAGVVTTSTGAASGQDNFGGGAFPKNPFVAQVETGKNAEIIEAAKIVQPDTEEAVRIREPGAVMPVERQKELEIKAIIGTRMAIITDGTITETVQSGGDSSWGKVGRIGRSGVYIGERFISVSAEISTAESGKVNPEERNDSRYSWPN